MEKIYDVIIVGGGPGGLQAALQLGRYCWKTLVVDRGKARSFFVPQYKNFIGFPDGLPGRELLAMAKKQVINFGVEVLDFKVVTKVVKDEDKFFTVTVQNKMDFKAGNGLNINSYRCRKVIFDTGVMDRHPDVPKVLYWAGHSIYYCPDCDGHEVLDKTVAVVGRGNAAAALAMALLNWTDNIKIVITDPEWPMAPEWQEKIAPFKFPVFTGKLKEFVGIERDKIEKIILENGQEITTEKVFSALGKYSVNSELAVTLGVEAMDNGQIIVDSRTKETSIENVWAVGDVVAYHPQQVTIAIGDGVQAAIWVNKKLRADGLLPRKDLI